MGAESIAVRSTAQRTAPALAATLASEHYRADIDGLRAIAVLAVVGFHAYPEYFPGGYVGVDVFFVISGFLISSIILRQLQLSRFTLADFYVRRVRRIFPALIVVLCTCLLVGLVVLLPDELEQLGKHLAAASIFGSNFALWHESGYFDRAAELNPLLHLWSLGIEEQFYLLWPMLLLLFWKGKRQHHLAATVMVLTLASFAISVSVGPEYQRANFFLPFSRFWELGLGCLLAIAESRGQERRSFDSNDALRRLADAMLPIVGVGLIGLAVFWFNRRTAHPGWATLLPAMGAMCVIVAHGSSWFQKRVMACGALVFIGLISYPLYLWHWPILSFATIVGTDTPEGMLRIAAVSLSILLAWLTFAFFELPIRAQRDSRTVWTLLGVLLIIGAAGLSTYAVSGFEHRYDIDVRSMRPEPRTDLQCLAQFPEDRTFNYCKTTSSAPPAVVFVGDSRSQGIYDGVADLMGSEYPLMLLGRGGCPPLLNVPLHYEDEHGCRDVWKLFVEYIQKVKPPVVVLIGGGSTLLSGRRAAWDVRDHGFGTTDAAFRQGLANVLASLHEVSRVIYVREIPGFDSEPGCFLRRVRIPGKKCSPTVATRKVEANMRQYTRIVDDMQNVFPAMRVIDALPALCGADVCSQKGPRGEILYSDDIHLSPGGGRYFAEASGLARTLREELIALEARAAAAGKI